MNVLVVGAGGREHALAWKISHSNRVDRVFCAPGNAGIGREAENVSIAANDFAGLIKFAQHSSSLHPLSASPRGNGDASLSLPGAGGCAESIVAGIFAH